MIFIPVIYRFESTKNPLPSISDSLFSQSTDDVNAFEFRNNKIIYIHLKNRLLDDVH